MALPTSPQKPLELPILSPPVAVDVFPELDISRILILSILSGMIWLGVRSFGTLGGWIGVVFTGIILLRSLVLQNQGKIIESLALVIYMAMVEPALRTFVGPLLYLTLEYFFVVWVILVLVKQKEYGLCVPAIFYLIYLVVEIFGVFGAFNSENGRSVLLFSMTIGFSLLLVNKLNLVKNDLRQLFMAILIGTTNLIVVIGYGYATSSVGWGSQSNSAASGDMGPVQISMLLAIGVIVLLLLADRVSFIHRLIYILGASFIALIMVLTFSRNGLYLTIIALITYYFLFSKFSGRTFVIILLLSILGISVFQFAEQFSGSAFITRYSNLNLSNRDVLVAHGWEIFLDNPIWGVGTSNYYQVIAQAEYFGKASGAHNELIRAAAEHGIVGLSVWLLFALSCVWLGLRQSNSKVRAIRMTLLVVFFAYLAVNGVKLLIQPLILLIALSINEF